MIVARVVMLGIVGLTVVWALLVGGCNSLDPYSDKFTRVEIGDSRARLLDTMGDPNTVNSVEVPLVHMEQLVWRSHANSRVYIVHVILDHVVTKSVIQ